MSTIFHQIFIFSPNYISLKTTEFFLILSKKLFLFSRHSNFYNFFLSLPHFPNSKGQMEEEAFMTSWIGLHKFLDIIFEITPKLINIKSSHLVRQYITNKGIFLNLFCNLESDWSLVPDPFYFWELCPLKGTGFERKNKVIFFKAFS